MLLARSLPRFHRDEKYVDLLAMMLGYKELYLEGSMKFTRFSYLSRNEIVEAHSQLAVQSGNTC